MNAVYLVSAKRTPIGSFLGELSSLTAPELGKVAIAAALKSAGIAPELVDQVYIGNVLSAGIGQAPARQASLAAGIPASVPTTTISKVCGSGLEAIRLGAQAIRLGDADLVVTGGMESMSNVPHYLPKSRSGFKMGDATLVDGMIKDGLWDPYQNYHMGVAGELCAKKYELNREAQDAYAAESYRRALEAQKSGAFDAELAEVSIASRKGEATLVSKDEEPGRGDPSKFASLRPAFEKDGTITAANASSINDGAAAVVLASEAKVQELGLTPLAKIVGGSLHAQEPEWFTTAPANAIEKLLAKKSLKPGDVDLYEINEAFSCVAMACTRLAGLDPANVNVHGGAVALGHPIGASGARILTTLAHALVARRQHRGVASICIGGGEAVSLLIERV